MFKKYINQSIKDIVDPKMGLQYKIRSINFLSGFVNEFPKLKTFLQNVLQQTHNKSLKITIKSALGQINLLSPDNIDREDLRFKSAALGFFKG